MKKVLLSCVALCAAMSMSAQIVKTVAEVCNYVDIEAEKANLTSIEVTSTTFATLENGTIFKGFQKSDGTETSITWNEKETYIIVYPGWGHDASAQCRCPADTYIGTMPGDGTQFRSGA